MCIMHFAVRIIRNYYYEIIYESEVGLETNLVPKLVMNYGPNSLLIMILTSHSNNDANLTVLFHQNCRAVFATLDFASLASYSEKILYTNYIILIHW